MSLPPAVDNTAMLIFFFELGSGLLSFIGGYSPSNGHSQLTLPLGKSWLLARGGSVRLSFGTGQLPCTWHLSCCATWEISSQLLLVSQSLMQICVSLGCPFWTVWICRSQIAISKSQIRYFYNVHVQVDWQLMGQEKVQGPNGSLAKWRIFVPPSQWRKSKVCFCFVFLCSPLKLGIIWWLAMCVLGLWGPSVHISFPSPFCVLS